MKKLLSDIVQIKFNLLFIETKMQYKKRNISSQADLGHVERQMGEGHKGPSQMRGNLKKVDPGDGGRQLVLRTAKDSEKPALSHPL